jgi:hypothetical protein
MATKRRGEVAEAVAVAQELVDPDGDLIAERGGHRVLAVGAAGQRHIGAPLGEIGHRRQHLGDLAPEDGVRLAQHQKVAGLGDVLRGRPPVHPAAVRLAHDAAELPDQRHDGVAGAGESLVDPGTVHEVQPGFRGDHLGRRGGNDPQVRLRPGQRDLDVEPGLPAVLQSIERADARIRDSGGGRECVAHERLGLLLRAR